MEKRSTQWRQALGTDDCPSLEGLLAALSDGNLPKEFEEHLAACPRCESEVALYREYERAEVNPSQEEDLNWIVGRLGDGASAFEPDSPRQRISTGPLRSVLDWLTGGGWRPLAPVGAALLAAVLLLVVTPTGPGRVGELQDPGVVRSSDLQLTAPLGTLTEAPRELAWEVPKGVAKFVIRVYEVDRTQLWEGQSQEGSIRIPESIRSQMTVGRRFLWQVVALDESGKQTGASEMADFEIRLATAPRESRDQ